MFVVLAVNVLVPLDAHGGRCLYFLCALILADLDTAFLERSTAVLRKLFEQCVQRCRNELSVCSTSNRNAKQFFRLVFLILKIGLGLPSIRP